MNLNFKNLPTDIQIDIISTLYFYDECHVEHARGKMTVQTSYCLKSRYDEDEWISQEFTQEKLDIHFDGNNAWYRAWKSLEQEHNKKWADIEDEAKKKCSADFDKMIKEKAKEDLERIIKEAQ